MTPMTRVLNKHSFHKRRTARAAKHLRTYARLTGSDHPEDAITDFITDCGHFADQHGLDFPMLLRRAIGHWLSEKTDPESITAPMVAIFAEGHEVTSNPTTYSTSTPSAHSCSQLNAQPRRRSHPMRVLTHAQQPQNTEHGP